MMDSISDVLYSSPEGYLRHIINVIPDHPIKRVAELLPWNVKL